VSDNRFSFGSSRSAIERIFRTLTLAAALIAVALLLGARFGGVLDEAELATVDTRFDLRGQTTPPAELLIVAIDDQTFVELDLQWPFPRREHARLIDRIAADGPAVIVYDVQFTEPTDPFDDNKLINAVAEAGSVVLATTEVDEEGRTGIFGGLPLAELGARGGSALFASDPGGVVRKISYDVERLPTIAVAAVETATGRAVPRDGSGEEWIDFHGSPGSVPTISFSEALESSEAGLFSDRIVVVGASAPTLKDLHTTSTSSGEFMSGPELEAHAISTVLRDFPLRSSPRAVDIALLIVLGLLPALLARGLALRWLVPAVVLLILAYLIAVQLAFNSGVVLPVLYPLVALALATVGVVGVTATAARLERERARAAFARFVPADVVDEVLLEADGDLRLGGVELDGTALFVDLRAFTPFVETHGPEDVLRVLNQYLETASNAIHAHGGTVVSFQGDGVMGVFGAPLAQSDHADRAVACARSLVSEGLPTFNSWLHAEGFDERFNVGIGLASGTLRSGNVGSQDRVEYAAIGDATNTAARLQALTRDTDVQALIAASVVERLSSPAPDLVDAGERSVRGKAEPVQLFTFDPGASAGGGLAASTLAE